VEQVAWPRAIDWTEPWSLCCWLRWPKLLDFNPERSLRERFA
jgi:hypothetical protein